MSTDTSEDQTITGPVHDEDNHIVQIDQSGISAIVRIDAEEAANPAVLLDALGSGVRSVFEADAAHGRTYELPDALYGGVAEGAALSLSDRDGESP